MDFSWAAIVKSVKDFWKKLSRPQRIILIAAPLIVATVLIFIITMASKPQYVPLFTKLSDTDAGALTAKLSDLKIAYTLADNGSTIMVKQQEAAAVRLQLANAGLPQSSKFSFDYLNQTRLGETDADRKLRYQLALQNEIETTLKGINGVQEARVHIVQPEPSLFTDKDKPASAAVTLKLVPGTTFTEEAVRGITNLLAASVEGLTKENVTIVDTAGNVLSDTLGNESNPAKLSGTQYQLQQTVENSMQKSVQSMLDRVLGADNTVVRVNAVLDFDQIKITQQTYGPGAIVSRQNTNETTTNGTAAGAVPGATTNIPGYTSPTTGGTTSSSSKTSSTENLNPDNTQKEQIVSPGAVKRLSISVLVDSDSESVQQTTIDQIKAIVGSAAGMDQARGDQIQVAAIPFDKTQQQQSAREIQLAQQRQRILTYAEIGVGVLLGIVLLLLFLFNRRRAKRNADLSLAKGMQPLTVGSVEEILMAQAEAEAEAQARIDQKKKKSAADIEKQKIKEAVTQYSKRNPDEVANLIKTWMSEDN